MSVIRMKQGDGGGGGLSGLLLPLDAAECVITVHLVEMCIHNFALCTKIVDIFTQKHNFSG